MLAAALGLAALVLASAARLAAAPSRAEAATRGDATPVYEIVVPAQNYFNDPSAAASGDDDQAALWLHHTSPSTPTISPDDQRNQRRVIDTWKQPVMWMLVRFLIERPSDWPRIDSSFGSILNLHSVAGDQGGIGWGYGSGVSPFHLAVGGERRAPLQPFVHVEQAGPYQHDLPRVRPGKVYTALIRLQFGRRDWIRPGEVDVWASADPAKPLVKQVQARNLDILIRATRPSDGASIVQRYVDGWDGGPYIIRSTRDNGGNKVWRHLQAATLFGETLDQMLRDKPVPVGTPNDQRSTHKPGASPDLGDAHAHRVRIAFPMPSATQLAAVRRGGPPPVWAARRGTPASVVDRSCELCSVSQRGEELRATIQGGLDTTDTAYDNRPIRSSPGRSGTLVVRDGIRLKRGQQLRGNLAILQVRDVRDALIVELYVDRDRILYLWSPPGGVRAEELNVSTNAVVPNNGTDLLPVEIALAQGKSLEVRASGTRRLAIRELRAATTGTPRFLRVGIDHYDTDRRTDPVGVIHNRVVVTRSGAPSRQ